MPDTPAASSISVTGGEMNAPVYIRVTRADPAATHDLTWFLGAHSGTIAAASGETLVTWTPDADVLGAYIPYTETAHVTVRCDSSLNGTPLGHTSAVIDLRLPADTAPVTTEGWITADHSNVGTAAAALSGCVRGVSKCLARLDLTKVTPKYGAHVVDVTLACGGFAASVSQSGTYTLGTLDSEVNVITAAVRDTRGKITTVRVSLSALSYTPPAAEHVSAYRCDAQGENDEYGTYYTVRAGLRYASLGGENSAALTCALAPSGGGYGPEIALTPDTDTKLGGTLSTATNYILRVTATDALGNTDAVEAVIPASGCTVNLREGGQGLGIGKYAESDSLVDVAWNMRVRGGLKLDGAPDFDQMPDYVTAVGSGNGWTYRRWHSGTTELWQHFSGTPSGGCFTSGIYPVLLAAGTVTAQATAGYSGAVHIPLTQALTDRCTVYLKNPDGSAVTGSAAVDVYIRGTAA